MNPAPRVAHRTHETQSNRGPIARRRPATPLTISRQKAALYRIVAGEIAIGCVKRRGIDDIHGAALTDVFGEPSDRTPEQRPSNEPAMSRTE